MEKKINIIKATGEIVPFSEEKYCRSLQKSGATEVEIDEILAKIQPHLKDRMTTNELYKITHQILRQMQLLSVGGRYNLKEAIRMLGPSGFPFERYCAELLKAQGYNIAVDQEVKGKCVVHELDIVATKPNERLMIECKFHSVPSERCPIQTALYIKARYDDVKFGCIQDPKCNPKYTGCWLVTNTKFSSVAINYGVCVGLNLLGWTYPRERGLEKIIDEKGLHPITCLSFLPKFLRQNLFDQGIVFCHDLLNKGTLLKQLEIEESKIKKILQECAAISKNERYPA